MDRDTGSGGPSTPSGHTARIRRRKGSNEVCQGLFGCVFYVSFHTFVFKAEYIRLFDFFCEIEIIFG